MSCSKVLGVCISLAVLVLLFVLLPAAEAGPPLICWPFEIGNAKSLPWQGPQWGAVRPDYDPNRLVGDTLALLTPETPVIVRMETLRRATFYAMKDQRIAAELLAQLQSRVKEAETKGQPDPRSLFDVGYLIESYRQAGRGWKSGIPAVGLDGYSMVVQAIRLRGQDAEMEFAAALMTGEGTSLPDRQRRIEHTRKALSGAPEGSLLAKNLVLHAHLIGLQGRTMAEIRAGLAAAKY